MFSFEGTREEKYPVTTAKGNHLYPCRTQKLSPFTSKILGGRLPGKIDSCRNKHSSIAQLAEHAAVNRRVVGSSPTGGANIRVFSNEHPDTSKKINGPLAQLVRATGS